MPIYMDRHDVSKEVTAEIVADLHQKDLKIQHNFSCRGLTYWFDDKRKTAFCLVEAPNKIAIQQMHDHAHGEVPHKIIEVDSAIVESFLGRIEDPKKSQKIALNIINEPAFRTIIVLEIKQLSLKKYPDHKTNLEDSNYASIINTIEKFNGRLVKQKPDYFLISFDSVTKAVVCSLKIHEIFKKSWQSHIGICGGIPVDEKESIFEDTIRTAERFCEIGKDKIVSTLEVKELYESENSNNPLDKRLFLINSKDEKFINRLMDYTERVWQDATLKSADFSKFLGYSKSQLYRKMIAITGKSPNTFIKDYRLTRALKLLNKRNENISEIAFETGFNSPAYFSKCFQETYGILPSTYLKTYY